MSFTSGKRAELGLPLANHDPQPWIRRGIAGAQVNVFASRSKYAPRSEYDVLDNPILVGMREDIKRSVDLNHNVSAHVQMWLSTLEDQEALSTTPEQVEHARRVLHKIAALS